MNYKALILSALVVSTATGFAKDKYSDWVAKGYRWVAIDGPYACPSKDDLDRILKDPSDSNKLKMVEQIKAYYLIGGNLVHVVKENAGPGGLTVIRIDGVTRDLYTLNRFLSKRPIPDSTGKIEGPQQIGATTAPGPGRPPSGNPAANMPDISNSLALPGAGSSPNSDKNSTSQPDTAAPSTDNSGGPTNGATPAATASPSPSPSPTPGQ
ncbi:MAG: hypothetical protein JO076_16435 [Verrucomicrobia bacterium]|nr:hypothetical protein [Verrucomicrobiota bacterium]